MKNLLTLILSFILLINSCKSNLSESSVSSNNTESADKIESSNDSIFETVEFKQYHFSIDVPKSWKRDLNNEVILICHMKCDTTVDFCSNFVINKISDDTNLVLKEQAQYLITQLESKLDSFIIVGGKEVVINEMNTIVFDYKCNIRRIEIGGTVEIIKLPDTVISITFMGRNTPLGAYVEDRTLFEKIIKSVKAI